MKKKKLMAWLLTGLMSFESVFGSVMPVAAAGENEAVQDGEGSDEALPETMEDTTADVSAEDVIVEDESFVRIVEKEPSEKKPNSLYKNLAKYMPDEEGIDYAAMPVTGLDQLMPAEGTVNTLVFMTEFADRKFKEGFKEDFSTQVFKPDTPESVNDPLYPQESLTAYYQRASFGKLTITGDCISYESEHDRDYYNNEYEMCIPLYQEILNDWAMNIVSNNTADSGMTDLEYLDKYLARYDANNDKNIDACYFVMAGGHTGWNSQWWSYRLGDLNDSIYVYIGSYAMPVAIQVVDCEHEDVAGLDGKADYLISFIHETGHQLGLDDYYSYDSDLRKIDTFAMMSSNGGDQDGFAKMLLGWLPEENVQWVTSSSENITLRPYAETGDIAIILPEEEKNENGIYSQFIMAEYYKAVKNDIVDEYNRKRKVRATGEIITLDQPEDGLRLYHIYAKLNESGTGFLVSNTYDSMIPLIENYWCNADKYWGFYRNGDELTGTSDPSSDFYNNPSGDGMIINSTMENSGISITGIVSGNDVLSFKVDFDENKEAGPVVTECTAGIDELYDVKYVKLTFDQPVNFTNDIQGAVYDIDPVSGQIIESEKWDGKSFLCRDYMFEYSKKNNVIYYVMSDVRMSDGMLVIPKGCVSTTKDILAEEIRVPVAFYPETNATLSVNKASGLYNKAFELEIGGAPQGSFITYTLDGKEPSPNDKIYSDPISIDDSCVIKAMAYVKNEDGVSPVSKRLRAEYIIEYAELNRDELTLCENEFFRLDVIANGSVTIRSSNGCVGIYTGGWIRGNKEGEAVVTYTTANGAKAECKVTVSNEPAKDVIAALKEEYGDQYEEMIAELSYVLNGDMTLAEFGAQGYLSKIWCTSVMEDTVYTGSAVRPEVDVFDGVTLLTKGKDYKLGYKNNKNAGTGKVIVTFLKSYKKQKAIEKTFEIRPAELEYDLYFFSECLNYTGKPQKVKPYLIYANDGKKLNIKASDFEVKYYNEMGRELEKLTDEGVYTAVVTAKGSNFAGMTKNTIKVQKKDVVEKLKVKKLTKSFKATGEAIIPQYGKDYTIQLPKGKGYDEILKDGQLDPDEFEVDCFNNLLPGKLVMVISATEKGNYSGTQIVTFKITK